MRTGTPIGFLAYHSKLIGSFAPVVSFGNKTDVIHPAILGHTVPVILNGV